MPGELNASDFEALLREAVRIRSEGEIINQERARVRAHVALIKGTIESQAAEIIALEVALAAFSKKPSASLEPAGEEEPRTVSGKKRKAPENEGAKGEEGAAKRKRTRSRAPDVVAAAPFQEAAASSSRWSKIKTAKSR